ncbi:hypothetical protein FA13DRAFT_1396523 [Coprinellus micaceus]|uniref:Uncharacterized protein n=1 Tax=Coprinellus micaceus TaxID=71717 RepID=A0A4Y7SQ74_COPMI|nr:hypothetical protein FA13DRAFT_1396523 [Coprinellus micaceus]
MDVSVKGGRWKAQGEGAPIMRRGDAVDGGGRMMEERKEERLDGRVRATRLDIGAHGPRPAFSEIIETPLPFGEPQAYCHRRHPALASLIESHSSPLMPIPLPSF